MAGITDYVLRSLVRASSSTCLLTTEMISSESLMHVQGTAITKTDSNHNPITFQLSGHKPDLMAKAAKMLEKEADIIDINMGCPVNKVVRGQDGCSLMRNPQLAADLVKAIKDVTEKPVSVKFRLGYSATEMNYVEFGQKMQAAGAEMITIHGRTRSQMYSGVADWKKIRALKENTDVVVFANGDVNSVESALRCLEESCADGVAVGRGILGNINLIHSIEWALNTGEILPPPSLDEKLFMLKQHLNNEIELRGEDAGIKFVRKFYPYYINNIHDAAKLRYELVREEDYKKIIRIIENLCCEKSLA